MTLGNWTFRRPHRSDVRDETWHLDPLKRGLVIEWDGGAGAKIAAFPVPHRGWAWAWAWPWILYKSIKAILQTRAAHFAR